MLLYALLFLQKHAHLSKLTARQNYIADILYLQLNKNFATSGLLQQLPKIIPNKFLKCV